MSDSESHLAKMRIDLAGRRLREQCEKPSILDADTDEAIDADIAIVDTSRRSHADALLRVRLGLTRCCMSEASALRNDSLELTLPVLHDERYESDRSLRSEEALLRTPPEGKGG